MIVKTINNSNKKILLPKISNEYLPSQNNMNLLNKIKDNNNFKKKQKLISQVFLTSTKEEEKEKYNFVLNNTINHENKIIHKILSDKIIINNKNSEKENKTKLFQRNIILIKYMNEALLYRKSIFQKNKIQVARIFKMSGSYNKNKIN